MNTNLSDVRIAFPYRLCWACALLLAVCLSTAAQEPQPPADPEVPPLAVPLPVLYRAFFGHVEFLEIEADKAQQRGENPQELRNYYRDLLGLTGASEHILKSQSARLLTTIRGIDQQIKVIIQTERAKFPKGEVRPGQVVPPPPAILAQLDQQKDAATLQGVEELRGLMGAEDFEKVDRHLQTQFAKNFTAVPAPSNPTPSKPLSRIAKGAGQ